MNIEEIRELIDEVVKSGIAELEVQRGENKVWIKRAASVTTQEFVVPAMAAPQPGAVVQAAAHPAPPASAPAAAAPAATPGDDLTDPSLIAVKSPIVGTFYASPAPGSPAFVKVGDAVSPGKVLCIIESMKLMNEIECEHTGTILKRLVESGQPVEYGEALFLVKPD